MSARRWGAAAAAAALLLAGCQLVDRPLAEDDPTAEEAPSPQLGRPDDTFPTSLAELLAFGRQEAATWQDDPRLTDLTVWLDERGEWVEVRVGYVAADAERLFTLRAVPNRMVQERPLLAGLELVPLTAAAVEELPPFPDDALAPTDLGLAAEDGLAQCDAAGGPVRAVVYATGAPGAWDGSTWTSVPAWRATVVTAAGGVVVDPRTGSPYAPLTCVEPVVLDTTLAEEADEG